MFPTTNSRILHTPTKCPTILFWHHLELPSDSKGLTSLLPLQMPVTHVGPQVTTLPADLATDQSSHDYPVLSLVLLEQLTELRKTVYLLWPMYYKGYNWGRVRCKRCTGQGMGGGMCRASKPSPHGHPPNTSMCLPTQKLSKPCHLGVLWVFHHIGMIDY